MKLRTEMQDGCVHTNGYRVDEDVEFSQTENLIHDAMAAHALMQAMGELRGKPWIQNSCRDGAPQWIEYRADELMREWTEGVG